MDDKTKLGLIKRIVLGYFEISGDIDNTEIVYGYCEAMLSAILNIINEDGCETEAK